ncbi:MAG: toprim domain-containing protein [Bacteroidota bacterium]
MREEKYYFSSTASESLAICFDYYVGEKIVNTKYRNLEKAFSQKKGGMQVLYGINDIVDWKREKLKWTHVIIVEGEMDKLALEVAGFMNVVSIPLGAGKGAKNRQYLLHAQKYLDQAEKIILAVDNDEAGTELQCELLTHFPQEKCWIVDWPEGCKDANDVLTKHGTWKLQSTIKYATHAGFAFLQFSSSKKPFIVHLAFIQYLERVMGYGKYRIAKNQSRYFWVQKKGKILFKKEPDQIKNDLREHFEDFPEILQLIISKKDLLSEATLAFIQDYTGQTNLIHDTSTSCRLYFQNGIVHIEKGKSIVLFSYDHLKGLIWERDLIPFTIQDVNQDLQSFEFHLFLTKICNGDEDRIQSIMTAIGYLLHAYKDPSNAKAIVLCDQYQSSDEANGGTGKSLILHAISYLRNTVIEDGKMFRLDRGFPFQKIGPSTRLFALDDLRKSFDLKQLYPSITGDMTIEQKHKDAFIIPFSQSPKIVFTTNYVMRVQGESDKRRIHEIELANHYHSGFSPKDDFGRRFFDDWEEKDWTCFYFLMFNCISMYLNHGLLTYDSENLPWNRFVAATSDSFAEYCGNLNLEFEHNLKESFESFQKDFGENRWTQSKFTRSLKQFAAFKNCEFKIFGANANRKFKFFPIED